MFVDLEISLLFTLYPWNWRVTSQQYVGIPSIHVSCHVARDWKIAGNTVSINQ